MELDVSVIKELINSLDRSGVDALCLETENFKLSLEKNKRAVVSAGSAAPAAGPCAPQSCAAQADGRTESPDAGRGNVVTAPIVGTFYTSPGPDKPVFAAVGKKVKKGDVLFIIESMKLMNEVASDYDGTVTEILAENGQAVEYGQPLLRIE